MGKILLFGSERVESWPADCNLSRRDDTEPLLNGTSSPVVRSPQELVLRSRKLPNGQGEDTGILRDYQGQVRNMLEVLTLNNEVERLRWEMVDPLIGTVRFRYIPTNMICPASAAPSFVMILQAFPLEYS